MDSRTRRYSEVVLNSSEMERVRRILRRGIKDIVPFYTLLARRRGLALCVIATVFLILYSGPSMFRYVRKKAPLIMDSSLNTILLKISDFEERASRFDVKIHRTFDPEDEPLAPFVGNGFLGYDEASDKFLLFHDRTLSLPLPVSPVVRVDADEKLDNNHVTRIVDFANGEFIKLESHNLGSKRVVSVQQEIVAHRVESGVFLQTVTVNNGGIEPSTIFMQQKLANKDGLKFAPIGSSEHVQITGKLPTGNRFIVFSLIAPKVEGKITLDPKQVRTFLFVSVVDYSAPVQTNEVAAIQAKLEDTVRKTYDRIVAEDQRKLNADHKNAWADLWKSGLSISFSKADNALNGDRINSTLYYVLSNIPNPIDHGVDLPALGKHCYKGHHTLNARTLWPSQTNIAKPGVLQNVVHLWILTLSKRGCQDLVMRGGPAGALQAMLMSFGGFLVHGGHLEFTTLPADLHRDYHYRNLIIFDNLTHLNVSVTINDENKAVLAAQASGPETIFACDGGCADSPVLISNVDRAVELPVKRTNPPTAILYVARDKRHLEELKHTLHVSELIDAPAHEDHVIAMHKHGNQLGGIPALLWATFALLVVVFHLFLARIICNEYFSGKGTYTALDTKKYVA